MLLKWSMQPRLGASYYYYYYLLLLHPFNGLFSRTTWVSRHQKGKPFWILLKQDMMGWQWHQLTHTQIICTSLQTDNYASTPPLSFYRRDATVLKAHKSTSWSDAFYTKTTLLMPRGHKLCVVNEWCLWQHVVTVSQKRCQYNLTGNFAKRLPLVKIFSPLDSAN